MRKAGAYGTTQEEALMISRISLPLAATLFCAAACVAQNTPLNAKTGEWEATIALAEHLVQPWKPSNHT